MGENKVSALDDAQAKEQFIDHLLKDIKALNKMLDDDMFESGITRIGVEQEMCLVDSEWRPAPINLEFLKKIDDDHFTTELARFNAELNMDPQLFTGSCLSDMEKNIRAQLLRAEKVLEEMDAKLFLTGILPTIKNTDLGSHSMTPIPRYKALNKMMKQYRGGEFEFRIEGTDELITKHNTVMFESANTSFQVHYQVDANDFPCKYNWTQVISAPLLAVATNSPLFFGKRLWRETRIALFQQAIDIRQSKEILRERTPRVNFGTGWVNKSIIEVYQEDIIRYKILLSNKIRNDSLEQLERGETPTLDALNVHNGTIYKWNRPCLGLTSEKPHIRIENRLLPAGPSLVDQVANSAFWLGMMHNIPPEYCEMARVMEFDDAKANLLKVARLGMDVNLRWLDGNKYPAKEIVLRELLPIAREGLEIAKVDQEDIDKYLGIIEERTATGRTGSQWFLDSYNKLRKEGSKDEALVATTAANYKRQRAGDPVHTWDLATLSEAGSWINFYSRIDQIMSTDLFAVNEDDYVDLVLSIMDWKKVRHVPVENSEGELVGLITSGLLVNYLFTNREKTIERVSIRDIMIKKPHYVKPETLTKDALKLMKDEKVGCLPVVRNKKLVGIVTEHDFVDVSHQLLKELYLKKDSQKQAQAE